MTASLRLLYVDTEPVWRGGQEQVLSLIKGMRDRGHHVAVAAPRIAPLAGRVTGEGISFFPFGQRAELSPVALWRLYRILRAGRFDIVHFNTQRPLLAGGLASRMAGRPVTICSRRVNFPLRSRLSALKFNLFMAKVVTVSASIKDTLASAHVDPGIVRVIYEGVDFRGIDRAPAPVLPLPHGKKIIGIVAHLSPEKGHSTLIKAFRRLLDSLPDVLLVIVGDGALRADLERLVWEMDLTDSVYFAGFRSDADALMKCFDVFCLPSLSEGLSSAILAAMSNRLPVVATRVGGIPELVTDTETGLLVEPSQSGPLAGALERLLRSPELASRMGNAGRRRVEQHFTQEAKLDGFENLYLELLAQRNFG